MISNEPLKTPRTDLSAIWALDTLSDLAKQYQAVGLVISDCGCWTVSLWVDGCKITEEDKSLAVAVAAVVERIENGKGK